MEPEFISKMLFTCDHSFPDGKAQESKRENDYKSSINFAVSKYSALTMKNMRFTVR